MIPESLANASIDDLRALRHQIRKRIALEDLARTQDNLEQIREECLTLKGFIKHAWNKLEPGTKFIDNWHMGAMCEHLTAVSEGQINRLLTNISPGASKSLTHSVLFPAWEWGPRGLAYLKYLTSSYNDGPVKRDARKHRDLSLSAWYRTLWPDLRLVRKGEMSFANSEMGTREGSPFGSLTSKRGDRLIVDDPHSTETAESDITRANTIRIFREGALDRLNDLKQSAIIVIMQRLHERDISGLIIDELKEQGFVHLMIPMRFEDDRACKTYLLPPPPDGEPDERPIFWQDPRATDGELMDPVRFPKDEVDKLESGKGDYAFAGQYQQRPAPRAGGMFKVANIEIVDAVPICVQKVRGWDIAGSTRKTSPYTVGLELGLGQDGYVYIMDVKRDRLETDKAEELIVTTTKADTINGTLASIPQDPGQAGKAQVRQYAKQLHGCNFKFSTETGAKQDRALPVASMVNAGMVRMRKAAWNEPLTAEMKVFPASTYKDQVDALSRAYSELIFPRDEDGIGGAEIIETGEGADDMRDRPATGDADFMDSIVV